MTTTDSDLPTPPDSTAEPAEETPEEAAEAGWSPDDATRSLLEQIGGLVAERDELRDQLMRSLADFQNFRKRMDTEKQMLRAYATQKLVDELLPVVDNLERAFAAITPETTVEQLQSGVDGVYRQLLQALATQNVRKIATVGEAFDPEYHEALVTEASEEHPAGTVLEELQPGYRMGDRTIRPARVKVSKAP